MAVPGSDNKKLKIYDAESMKIWAQAQPCYEKVKKLLFMEEL
jgi:hypothetical protein